MSAAAAVAAEEEVCTPIRREGGCGICCDTALRALQMDKEIQRMLEDAGIDVAEGIARVVGKEELYLRLLRKFRDMDSFPDFLAAVQTGSAEDAFNILHSIKGVTANLSLAALNAQCRPAVEVLREAKNTGAACFPDNMPELIAEHDRVMEALRKLPD